MKSSASNAQPVQQLKEQQTAWLRPRIKQQIGLFCFAATTIFLVALLTACGSPAPLPCEPLPTTSPPATVSQPPRVPYSMKVESYFKKSAETLTNASVTSN